MLILAAILIATSTGFLLAWGYHRSKTREIEQKARGSRHAFLVELSRDPVPALRDRAADELRTRGWGDGRLLPDDAEGLLHALEAILASLPDDKAHRDAVFDVGGLADVVQALRLKHPKRGVASADADVWSPPD